MTQIHSMAAAIVIVAGFVGALAAMISTWSRYRDKAISALLYQPDPNWWPEPQQPMPFQEEPSGTLRIIVPIAAIVVWIAVLAVLVWTSR